MKVSYDKLWELLTDKKKKKTDLIKMAKISPNTLAKLSKNEFVKIETIAKIAQCLNVQLSDIAHIEQISSNVEKKDDSIKIASLFSGIGGFEEGIKLTNIPHKVVFASEIDKYARLSYSANFYNDNLYGDIKEINENEIPDHDCMIAGFPCQSFSIAGKKMGFNDTRGTLFFDIARILKVKKPKYIILENVKNLVSHDHGKTIRVILNTLNEIGYTIDFTVINSNEAGVPQNRDRTYIVGIYNGEVEKYIDDDRNLIVNRLKKELNKKEFKSFNFFNDLIFSKENKYIEDILEKNVDSKYYLNKDKVNSYLAKIKYDDKSKNENKIIKLFDLPKEVHNDLERQRRVYSVKGISPTVLARSDSTKIFINKENKIRKITPEENFYIQGFEKDFVENIRKTGMSATQMYKQSGNAVSPPVIRGIFKKLVETQQKFKFIDLFSGLGGFRIAMEEIGGKCVFSSEIDKYVAEIYKENFGSLPEGDITKIDGKEVPDHDILCAGFPCQPFSIAGKRLGFEDTRGTLFFDILRIIKDKKPKAIFLENVAGLKSHDGGKTLRVIEESLKMQGYCINWKIVNAKDIGIPQNRNRWYCVGVRKDLIGDRDFNFSFPTKKSLMYTIDDILEKHVSDEYTISNIAKGNIDTYITKFLNSNRYDKKHKIIASEIRKSRCNFRSDGISPCLTAKMGTGGNNIPVLVEQNRKLTERECLRIMGFPESYYIKPKSYQSYKQIGNSVVIPAIKEIAVELKKYLK